MNSLSRSGSALRRLGNAPLPLLILTGMFLGSMLPMSRLASADGWSPLAFAFWPALGSGLALTLAGLYAGGRTRTLRPVLLYSLIAGVVSVAIPNSVTFIVMPDLGTSLTSLVFTLPPLFTYAFAWLMGIERYRPLRLVGIVLGLSGAALLVLSRSSVGSSSVWWLALAICAPISLAIGNIYRKLWMPQGLHSGLLAGGMLLGGALTLLPLLLASGAMSSHGLFGWSVMLAQCALTSLGYVVYFRFQKVADPVYFSQIGYVMAATGVFSGLLFFHERLTVLTLFAIVVMVAGIALVNKRPREAKA